MDLPVWVSITRWKQMPQENLRYKLEVKEMKESTVWSPAQF